MYQTARLEAMATFTSGGDSFTANVVDLVIGNVSIDVHIIYILM